MTTKAKPTPGPWTYLPDDEHLADGDSDYDAFTIRAHSPEAFRQWGLMGDYRGTEVAKVRCNPSARGEPEWETIEANARLLAAAPELRDALRSMCALAYSLMNPGSLPGHYWQAFALLKRIEGGE